VDQVAAICEEAAFAVDQIPGDLLRPKPVWRSRDPGDLNTTRLEIDHEEHEVPNETAPRHDLYREEVGCRNRAPMSPQERLPSHGTTPSRIDSVLGEHALDRVSANLVSEIHQGSADASVSPARILKGHPNDQLLDFALDSRTSGRPL
jgi:hypothetical protein